MPLRFVYGVLVVLTALPVSAAERPNIILVLADDLGWSELGCYGNDFNETPHLDRLSREGMRFTQAYAAAPVCSPYRAALLTGQYPARVGITDYLRPDSGTALSVEHVTLAEMLQQEGYTTGLIGKWHLTGYKHHGASREIRPTSHGFDYEFAAEVKSVGNGANFWPYMFRRQTIRWVDIPRNRLGKNEYLVDRMNDAAVRFIEANKARPFFLCLSHYAPHTILNGKPELVAKFRKKHPPGKSTRQRCYLCEDAGLQGDSQSHWAAHHNPHLAAMLASIDSGVGAICTTLKKLELDENTIVIFTSDNGGELNVTSNAPLRGGKSQLYEGGIRVPQIVRWPGKVPARSINHQPTVNVDFYPTLLGAAGIRRSETQQLDGVNTLSSWKNPRSEVKRDAIYWHYPLDKPHFLGGRSAGAIRQENWKLIEYFETGDVELFDLDNDIGERNNQAPQRADMVAELRGRLAAWRRDVGAHIPSAPLMCELGKVYFEDSFSAGQVSDRWFFQKCWGTRNGVLVRNALPGENQRLFIKKPEYRNVAIRFDFQFQGAKEIRLMTGTPGHYNAVVHIHPDHFFIQTAVDQSVPFYPSIQGECAFRFEANRWYSMTVEIQNDEIIAHVDKDHFVIGKHPILDRTRTYFAFQVDQPSAAFDNVSIRHAKPRKDWRQRRGVLMKRQANRPPIPRPLRERIRILQTNVRDRLYRGDTKYLRSLRRLIDNKKKNEKDIPRSSPR